MSAEPLATCTQDGDKQGVFRDTIMMAMGLLVGRLRYSSITSWRVRDTVLPHLLLLFSLANAAMWNWYWNPNPI